MTKQGKKMKKYLLPFLAFATLALAVACGKDSDESVTPPQNPEQPTEGVFSPQRRIASIWVDGAASEQWVWENNLLQRVEVPNDEGTFETAGSFSYDASSRFATATVTDSMFGSMVVNYSYQGSLLQSLDVNVMGMSAVTANVQHSGDKASHVDLEINSAVLQLLASLLGGGGGEQDVVPSEELLDVGGVDAVAVVVRQSLLQQGEHLLALSLLGVEGGGLAVQVVADGGKDLVERLFVGFGEKADLAQRADAVVLEDGVLLIRDEVLNDGTAFGLRHQFTEVRLAGNH